MWPACSERRRAQSKFMLKTTQKSYVSLEPSPICTIHKIIVGSTVDNLAAAIVGEEYERDVMYPDFLAEAQSAKQSAAERTFHLALEAEREHARLYRDALRQLQLGRPPVVYYVCLVCGFTTSDGAFARCQVCNNPREKFESIS